MPTTFPPIGTPEDQELDFKSGLNRRKDNGKVDHFELAKDIAAFANAYGGRIIVGAQEIRNSLSQYTPMTKEEATTICDEYGTAHATRLRPAPIVTRAIVEYETGYLAVITVQSSMGQAIGVRVKKEEVASDEPKTPPEIFAFPLRVGDQTNWLQPEQLNMLMIPELRRNILLLRQARGHSIQIDKIYRSGSPEYGGAYGPTITEIRELDNALIFGDGSSLALNQVTAVWKGPGGWRILWAQ